MKKIIACCFIIFCAVAQVQSSEKALYGIKTRFEQEICNMAQTYEQQQVFAALSLADKTSVQEFIAFLEENSLQPSLEKALYISAAIHMHVRLKVEIEFLVKTMYVAQMHDRYWNKEFVLEQAPLYTKAPNRWLYSANYTQKIQKHIQSLESIQDVLAVQLGKYLYLVHELERIQSVADIQKFFEHEIQNQFFGDFIIDSIPHPAIQRAYAFHECAQNFQMACQEVCVATQIPSHIDRNKLAYGATLLGLLACAMVVHKNIDAIKNGIQDVSKALPAFIESNVMSPIQKISDVIFNKNTIERKSLEESKFDVSGDIDLLDRMAKKHGKSLEGLSREEMRVVIQDVSQLKNEYLTRAFYLSSLIDSENAQKFLDAGSFKSTELILQGKLSLNNALEALEQPLAEGNNILDQMKLMVPMMALTPAAFIGFMGYKTTEGLYEFLFKRKFITQPFKDSLRMIHTLLNEHIHMQEKEYRAEGYLYFYTQILEVIGEKLSLGHQQTFYEDIALLQKYEYSYEQKFNIVQRMYTTYSFLHQ